MSETGFTLGNNFGAAPQPDAQPAAGNDLIRESDDRGFMADVIEASREVPVLVDFWAPWCGPCRQLTPVLEKAVRAAKGKVRLVKVNIDESPGVAGQLGVQSIPAVIAFSNGQPLDGFMGALPESQITAFIERIAKAGGGENGAGAQIEEALTAADDALAAKDTSGAAQLYAAVLQADPENARALAGLVRCQIAAGALDQAQAILDSLPETAKGAEIDAARTALDMAREAKRLGDPSDHARKVEADPDDHEARMGLAKALAAKGDRQGAVDALLEIVRRDPEWNGGAGRQELLRFFEAWGPKDPATIAGRRKLSSLLFA